MPETKGQPDGRSVRPVPSINVMVAQPGVEDAYKEIIGAIDKNSLAALQTALRKATPPINRQDGDGNAPLHKAVMKLGEILNTKPSSGESRGAVIDMANNSLRIIQAIINAGADKNIRNNAPWYSRIFRGEGQTAAEIAKANKEAAGDIVCLGELPVLGVEDIVGYNMAAYLNINREPIQSLTTTAAPVTANAANGDEKDVPPPGLGRAASPTVGSAWSDRARQGNAGDSREPIRRFGSPSIDTAASRG